VSKAVLLDSGPLGMIVHPRAAAAIVTWVNDQLAAAHRLLIPEIADYEVRRELLRANLQPSVARLDMLKRTLEYLPLTTDTMLQAAAFWAQARQAGTPTAADPALDGDVILAAQAAILGRSSPAPLIIATTNVGHLARFATAHLWHTILP
jgi:hypothetical protein